MDFYERYDSLCRAQGETPSGVGLKIGVSKAAVNYWKEGHIPKQETLLKIANYFEVPIAYVAGLTDNRNSTINGADIAKVALFGGDVDVTDEMWEEAKQYAEFIKAKQKKEQ